MSLRLQMGRRLRFSAIFALCLLNLAPRAGWTESSHFEDVTTCETPLNGQNPGNGFPWMNPLGVTIDREFALQTDVEDPAEKPTAYDLKEPLLSKLRSASRHAARKCRNHICGDETSKGLCYRGVKEALLNCGLASRYLPGSYATQAKTKGILTDAGFEDVLSKGFNATNAPLGAVLVYSGGPENYGHIEIKLGPREYCSDFCRATPVNQSLSRKLIGIYVKTSN